MKKKEEKKERRKREQEISQEKVYTTLLSVSTYVPDRHSHQPCIACTRAHKNGRLEEERVTPIEACSPVKLIGPY